MVDLVKSTVKCYKKKTKKVVGGRKKTYEYNQYQVPLKKSDNLACSEEVFVVPQSHFEDIIEAEVESHKKDLKPDKSILAEFEKELADLEWKHGELSRSYKALVSKNAQTNKKFRLEKEKTNTLNGENTKLKNQLKSIYKEYQNLKDINGTLLEKIKSIEDESSQDLWKSIKNRFSTKEIKDKEDQE